MSVMDLVRRWKEKNVEDSERYKEMEKEYFMQKKLEDRQKSANERELERIYKRRREDAMRKELDVIRKKETKEAWKGKNLFNGKGTMLKDDRSVLKDNKKLLNNKGTMLNSSKIVSGGFGW